MNTDLSTLTGAYAVNAVTGVECEDFERHLADCADCAQEVDELRETAARLGADTTASAPVGLRQRVLDEIARTRQDAPQAEGQPSRTVRRIPLRRWGMRAAVAAAVLGVALAGVFGGMAWHAQQQLAGMREQIERAGDHGAEMAQVLRARDAHMVQGSMGEARATTVVSHELGRAMFLTRNMPPAPADRVYQLWFIGADGPNSAGLLPLEPGKPTSSMIAPMPADTAQMAVTVEPPGGSARPTTDPIMVMAVA